MGEPGLSCKVRLGLGPSKQQSVRDDVRRCRRRVSYSLRPIVVPTVLVVPGVVVVLTLPSVVMPAETV